VAKSNSDFYPFFSVTKPVRHMKTKDAAGADYSI